MKTLIAILFVLSLSVASYGNPGMGVRSMRTAQRMATPGVKFKEFGPTATGNTNGVRVIKLDAPEKVVKPVKVSIVNEIQKELRGTIYIEKETTVEEAKRNHSGTALNCAAYAFRIADIAKKKGVATEIYQAGGAHVVVVVVENGKRICFSNGRIVREEAYEKITLLK